MSSQLEKLRKRSRREVQIDGDTFYQRDLTSEEVRVSETLADPNLKADWVVGTTLVDADGSRVCPVVDGESPEEFAKRMSGVLKDVEEPKKVRLLVETYKAMQVPSLEKLAKN